MRYRLQRKEQYVLPNVLGNKSFPIYTHRWKDVALSNDLISLKKMIPVDNQKYRIIDTENCGDEA